MTRTVRIAGRKVVHERTPASAVISSPRRSSTPNASPVDATKAARALGTATRRPSNPAARRRRFAEAPMSRSRASWRLRPAMMMLNVLEITMEETNSAMTKNVSPTRVMRSCAVSEPEMRADEFIHAVRIPMPWTMAVPNREATKTTRKLGMNCRGFDRISLRGFTGSPPRRGLRVRASSERRVRRRCRRRVR